MERNAKPNFPSAPKLSLSTKFTGGQFRWGYFRPSPYLPKMPCPSTSSVVVLRISSVDPPEQYCQRIFSTWDCYQMHMVGHYAPSQQSHLSITQIVSQQSQVSLTVFLYRESHALIYTTLRDVIRHTRYHASRSSRHTCILFFNPINKSRSSGCPPFPPPFSPRNDASHLWLGSEGSA
jgi:hypothetical protein